MNKKIIFSLAEKKSPRIDIVKSDYRNRHDVVQELSGTRNFGIELGVAKGIYSRRMIKSGCFEKFFGVDVYGDIHDTKEYIETLKFVGFNNSKFCLIRSDFDSALSLFPDEYFDFIYVDGFAHTGEEGGKTFIDWWPKLKLNGILAGDDYHADWPLVVWAVNEFASAVKQKVRLTTEIEDEEHSRYPTWFIKKETSFVPKLNKTLYAISQKEKRRIHRLRTSKIWNLYFLFRRKFGRLIRRHK